MDNDIVLRGGGLNVEAQRGRAGHAETAEVIAGGMLGPVPGRQAREDANVGDAAISDGLLDGAAVTHPDNDAVEARKEIAQRCRGVGEDGLEIDAAQVVNGIDVSGGQREAVGVSREFDRAFLGEAEYRGTSQQEVAYPAGMNYERAHGVASL